MSDVTDEIEIQLIGDASITTPVNTYEEEGARILKNGSLITDSPSVSYTNNVGTPATLQTMNSTPGSYTVTYSYSDKSVKRSVTITQ